MTVATADAFELDDWLEAVSLSRPVGSCSSCLGLLMPQVPEKIGHRVWYTAICLGCRREVVSPDGKRKHVSSTDSFYHPDRILPAPRERTRDVKELAAHDG